MPLLPHAHHTPTTAEDVPAAVKGLAPQGVDKLGHSAGNPAALATTLKAGGAVASTLGATAEQFGEKVTVATIMAAQAADKHAALLERVAKGELRVNVETAIPLERASEAFAAFADGTFGKVLLTR